MPRRSRSWRQPERASPRAAPTTVLWNRTVRSDRNGTWNLFCARRIHAREVCQGDQEAGGSRSGQAQGPHLPLCSGIERCDQIGMALGIYFVHEGFTPEKYAKAIKKLEAAGAGKPKGRTYHCALESNGAIRSEWHLESILCTKDSRQRSMPRRSRSWRQPERASPRAAPTTVLWNRTVR